MRSSERCLAPENHYSLCNTILVSLQEATTLTTLWVLTTLYILYTLLALRYWTCMCKQKVTVTSQTLSSPHIALPKLARLRLLLPQIR